MFGFGKEDTKIRKLSWFWEGSTGLKTAKGCKNLDRIG